MKLEDVALSFEVSATTGRMGSHGEGEGCRVRCVELSKA